MNRPSLFNDTNYTYWEALIRIFIQALDYDILSAIINRPHTLTIVVDGISFPKPKKDWNEEDKRLVQLKVKAMNILYYTLDTNEFNQIFTCNLAKKI